MAKTMTPSEMTDGQIERAVEILRAKLRKHKKELPSFAVQIVLGQKGLAPDLLSVLRKRVNAVCGTIVTVDRSTCPEIEDWMKKVIGMDKLMDPELKTTGPTEFDLATQISLWLHSNQKHGTVTGQTIYNYLKKNGMLESCLGLQDALAIQKLGVAVFQKVFGNRIVYFWKSVARKRDSGSLNVPCLHVDDDVVELNWNWLGHDWNDDRPAARFKK